MYWSKTVVAAAASTRILVSGLASGDSPEAKAPPEKANPQMQAVLDAHAAIQPKPIENLSPEEARKQPTIADAVARLLKEQGTSIAQV